MFKAKTIDKICTFFPESQKVDTQMWSLCTKFHCHHRVGKTCGNSRFFFTSKKLVRKTDGYISKTPSSPWFSKMQKVEFENLDQRVIPRVGEGDSNDRNLKKPLKMTVMMMNKKCF